MAALLIIGSINRAHLPEKILKFSTTKNAFYRILGLFYIEHF